MSNQNWFRRTEDEWSPLLSAVAPQPPIPPGDGGEVPDPEEPAEPPPSGQKVSHGMDLRSWHTGLINSSLLTAATGPMSTSRDGQLIQNRRIIADGKGQRALQIFHRDVTVRNCHIIYRNMANGVHVHGGNPNVVIENCFIQDDIAVGPYDDDQSDPTGEVNPGGSVGLVCGNNGTVIRWNYMSGHRAGMALGNDNLVVVENYLAHNFNGVERPASWQKGSGINYRGGQAGNVVIARNWVNCTGSRSAAFNLYPDKPIRYTNVFDNYARGNGGGWGINGGDTSSRPLEIRQLNRDIRIEGMRFEGDFQWPTVLGEGTNAGVNLFRTGNTFVNNQWLPGSGTIVGDLPARCGVRQNACE